LKLKSIKLEYIAVALFMFTAFNITLWRFGANQSIAVLALLVIFYRPWRRELFSLQWLKTPVLIWSGVFIIWCIISLSYSEAPNLAKAAQGITMYSKLLFLLAIPIAFRETRYRRWVENALIYGVLINVILSVLYYYQFPAWITHYASYFSMNITFSINPLQMIYIVVMALWLLTMRICNREFAWHDVVVGVLLLAYLWLINLERSGFLIFIALFILFLGQRFGKKAVGVGLIAVPVFLGLLYFFLPPFQNRVNIGIQNIEAFQQTENVGTIGPDNSLGLRLAFTMESIPVIKDHLLFGTGVGSFRYVHAKLYPEQQKVFPANDPHEAYIYVAFELGMVGLAIYIAWLVSIFRWISRLPQKERYLLRGIWLIFVVMGFTDSGLPLNAIGLSFVLWLSLYLRPNQPPLAKG